MKKPLIIALTSIVITGILMFQLYEHTDIEFVDNFVETIAETTGIGQNIVEQKAAEKLVETNDKEAQTKRRLLEAARREQQRARLERVEYLADSARVADSIHSATTRTKRKKLFNSVVDTAQLIAMTKKEESKAEEPKKKKRLFNSSSDETVLADKTATNEASLRFFNAKIHGAQKFNNNDDVIFRLAQRLQVDGVSLNENVVFKAKANVFDDRINFVIKSINDVPIRAETFTKSNEKGIPIQSNFLLKGGYLFSDGMDVMFGFKN